MYPNSNCKGVETGGSSSGIYPTFFKENDVRCVETLISNFIDNIFCKFEETYMIQKHFVVHSDYISQVSTLALKLPLLTRTVEHI